MRTKAISPVIATVIIVSVAIAIAVAVAFWMTGITGLFTRYEKLEVVNAYAVYDDDNLLPDSNLWNSTGWNVTVVVKNTGSTTATIDDIFINGKPFNVYKNQSDYQLIFVNGEATFDTLTVEPGQEATLIIGIGESSPFTHGIVIEVKLHTAAGNEYPKSVQLP